MCQLPTPIWKGRPSGLPSNWYEIAAAVKVAAGWRCEACGAENSYPLGRVLTVHHLDMNQLNCDYGNLVALCQVCHLRIQANYIPGQMFAFEVPEWAAKRGLA